jgi:salicylate hydroxylase
MKYIISDTEHRKAPTIKCWRIRDRIPLQKYTYGSTILIGDAAHPMLPLNAQGGNQALEDAGALLTLFLNLESGKKEEIKERMRLFDLVSTRRAGRQQIINSVPPSEVTSLGDRLKGFEDESPGEEGETAIERIVRELGSVFVLE